MLGTPCLGTVDVEFDVHSRGRMSVLDLPSFSGPEIYAVLNKFFGKVMDFEVFLSIWSCFDGIPGLYELAVKENAITTTSLVTSVLFRVLSSCLPLQEAELQWLNKINAVCGFEISAEDKRDPILLRLMIHGVIVLSGNTVYLRDRILLAYTICSNQRIPEATRLQNLCGIGFESLVKSIGADIIQNLNLQGSFNEVALGYGPKDVDLVYSKVDTVVCFSCKMSPEGHAVSILANLEAHFATSKPPTIYLILCSPSIVPQWIITNFVKARSQKNLSWNPRFHIESANIPDLMLKLSQHCSFFTPAEVTIHSWPYLKRTTVLTKLRENKNRIIHIQGHRRVGKTFTVKTVSKDGLYVDFKTI